MGGGCMGPKMQQDAAAVAAPNRIHQAYALKSRNRFGTQEKSAEATVREAPLLSARLRRTCWCQSQVFLFVLFRQKKEDKNKCK